MPSVHTHYDNLKVSRTASSAEIRTAYKKLVQKHHPDKFTDVSEKAKATKITHLLNTAYTVLSDDKKRADHDYWISKQEAPKQAQRPSSNQASQGFYNSRPSPNAYQRQSFRKKSPLEPEDYFEFRRNDTIFPWGYYRDACLRQLEVDWVYWDSPKLFKENRLLDRRKIQDSLYLIQSTLRHLYEYSSIPPSSIKEFSKDNKAFCSILIKELAYLKSQKELAEKLTRSPWRRRFVNLVTDSISPRAGLKLANANSIIPRDPMTAMWAGVGAGLTILLMLHLSVS